MAEIEIYSAVLCPFAHRSRLTLQEKGIPFKLIEIDLQNKPANFKEISPYGKVPVLKHGDRSFPLVSLNRKDKYTHKLGTLT